MIAWMVFVASLIFMMILVLFYRYIHGLERRISVCAAHLQTTVQYRKRTTKTEKQIKQLYEIINRCVVTKNLVQAFRAIEVLKLAFGEEFARKNEAIFLKTAVIFAMRSKSYHIAVYLMDAFTPLARTDEDPTNILKQMVVIGLVAYKHHHNHLFAKCIDGIFLCLTKKFTEETYNEALHGLQLFGMLAIRRADSPLYREIMSRLSFVVLQRPANEELLMLLSSWLYAIVKQDQEELFDIFNIHVMGLITILDQNEIRVLLNEWQIQTSTACLNPGSTLKTKLIKQMVEITCLQEDIALWSFTSHSLCSIAKVILDRQGSICALEVLYPILNTARSLLVRELNLAKAECQDEVRQKILFILTKEVLIFSSYWAKKDIYSSVGERILTINDWWISLQKNSPATVKKYTQLLLFYWYQSNKRKAKRTMPASVELASLLTSAERQQLTFL